MPSPLFINNPGGDMKWVLTLRQENGIRHYPCATINIGDCGGPLDADSFAQIAGAVMPKLCMSYARAVNLVHMNSLIPEGSEGIEIGCDWGDGILRLMETGAAKIHGVDPYLPDQDTTFTAVSEEEMENRYLAVVERTKDERVQIHRAKSQDYLKTVAPESMDWIFIDGNHYEEPAYEDMVLSYKALKPGGLMFIDDVRCAQWGKYVQPALRRFLEDHPMKPVNIMYDPAIFRKA